MKSNQGFTLMEVLIALLIIAISLTALLTSTSQTIHNSSRIKDKTIKHWLEIKMINKIQMQAITITKGPETTLKSRAFGRTFYLKAKLSPTTIKNVDMITLKISDNKFGPYQDPIQAFYYEKN